MAIHQASDLARARLWHDAELVLAPIVQRSDAPAAALDLQARVCAQQGRVSEAEALWARALNLDPTIGSAQAGLAKVRRTITRPLWMDAAVRVGTVILGGAILVGVLVWQNQQQEASAAALRKEVSETLAAQSKALLEIRGEVNSNASQNTAVQQASLAAHLATWQKDLRDLIEQEHNATVAKISDSSSSALSTLAEVQKSAAGRLKLLNELSSSLAGLTTVVSAAQAQLKETNAAVATLSEQAKSLEVSADKRTADLQLQIKKAITQSSDEVKDSLTKTSADQQKAAAARLDQLAELSTTQGKALAAAELKLGDTQTAVGTLVDQVKSSETSAGKRAEALQTQIEQSVTKSSAQTKEGVLKALEQQKTASAGKADQLTELAASLASLVKLQNSTQAQVAETQAALSTLVNQVKTSQTSTEKRFSDVQSQLAKAIEQQKAPTTAPQP